MTQPGPSRIVLTRRHSAAKGTVEWLFGTFGFEHPRIAPNAFARFEPAKTLGSSRIPAIRATTAGNNRTRTRWAIS